MHLSSNFDAYLQHSDSRMPVCCTYPYLPARRNITWQYTMQSLPSWSIFLHRSANSPLH
uniref:Uncharacterized protein n=1 Tax=Aegilops tauschii subsp. strangulata TaxID=200361 RepID=A0A452XX01_AEGTS